jgi:hypothetical protein
LLQSFAPVYLGRGMLLRLAQLDRRFARKFKNFKAAVALHYSYYNFLTLPNSSCQALKFAGTTEACSCARASHPHPTCGHP